MSEEILAWHLVGTTLRDGRPIPADGKWLVHRGAVVPCKSGLHASARLIDALQYAPGNTVCRVVLKGNIAHHENDKLVASRRKILWRYDAGATLSLFAHQCALDVAHLWDMPPIVRQYLETGDEAIRDAASAAAWAAARAAASAAARAAASAAARDTAWAKLNDRLEAMVAEAAGQKL